MIVVDTSALLAIALQEAEGPACARALADADGVAMSAGTLHETLVVARRRDVADDVETMIAKLKVSVYAVDEATARRTAATYDRWGKGIDPAGLNLADCFAYTLARDLGCPLLYIGNDFARTDIASAI